MMKLQLILCQVICIVDNNNDIHSSILLTVSMYDVIYRNCMVVGWRVRELPESDTLVSGGAHRQAGAQVSKTFVHD